VGANASCGGLSCSSCPDRSRSWLARVARISWVTNYTYLNFTGDFGRNSSAGVFAERSADTLLAKLANAHAGPTLAIT